MADKLDHLIADSSAELDRLVEDIAGIKQHLSILERQREITIAQLEAFQLAASLRPNSPTPTRRGRQLGAISAEWKAVLEQIYSWNRLLGESASYSEILDLTQQAGVTTSIDNVRERVRSFINSGLLRGDPSTGFFVTETAVEKFRFDLDEASRPPDGEDFGEAL